MHDKWQNRNPKCLFVLARFFSPTTLKWSPRSLFTIGFWKSVVLWVKSLHISIDSLNDYDIIFGLIQKRPHWLLLNHIIIAGKQIIYQNHLKNSVPLLSHLIAKLRYIESIERAIAKKNNRPNIHERKWKPLLNI